MIISASRRTDIPALYGEWFMNRLKTGCVLVPNPRFRHRLSQVDLSRDAVDCIVFWTKNPIPFMPKIEELQAAGYHFYFEFTLNPYDRTIEPNLPKKSRLIRAFQDLSRQIGKVGVDWRYDPILLTDRFSIDDHVKAFTAYCQELAPFTERCILSFVDSYTHLRKTIQPLDSGQIDAIARQISEIATSCHLQLFTCAESVDLERYGIRHGSCIDPVKVEQVTGQAIKAGKDRSQRPACRCMDSTDIGIYDTCIHGCTYCYATKKLATAIDHYQHHDVDAPMLTGYPHAEI